MRIKFISVVINCIGAAKSLRAKGSHNRSPGLVLSCFRTAYGPGNLKMVSTVRLLSLGVLGYREGSMFGNPLPPIFLNIGVWSTLLNFGLLLPINPIIV